MVLPALAIAQEDAPEEMTRWRLSQHEVQTEPEPRRYPRPKGDERSTLRRPKPERQRYDLPLESIHQVSDDGSRRHRGHEQTTTIPVTLKPPQKTHRANERSNCGVKSERKALMRFEQHGPCPPHSVVKHESHYSSARLTLSFTSGGHMIALADV